MKNLISFGLLMLVLGFAIGWLVKPAPLSSAPTVVALTTPHKSAAANVPTETPVPRKRAQREPAVKKQSDMSDEKLMAEQTNKMHENAFKLQRGKLEQLIDHLAESLNLSADQKDKITAWLDDNMKKLEGLDFSDPDNMSELSEFTKLLTNKGLEDQLVSFLTNDQRAALVDFKEFRIRNQADTVALKSLSQLQGIMRLEDSQRDEVYKLLATDAEARARVESENLDIKKTSIEGFLSIETDPYGVKLEMLKDGAAVFENVIDAKVELLRPALNAKQLEQYRTELQTKGFGIYGVRP